MEGTTGPQGEGDRIELATMLTGRPSSPKMAGAFDPTRPFPFKDLPPWKHPHSMLHSPAKPPFCPFRCLLAVNPPHPT